MRGTEADDRFIAAFADRRLDRNEGDDTFELATATTQDGAALEIAGGNDSLFGLGGDDELLGGTGADALDGGAGNDVVNGGAGADRITGGTGDNFIIGDTGADTFYLTSGGVDRIFDFEAGVDVLEITGTVADAIANATDAVDAAGVNLAVITDASGIFVLRGYTAAELRSDFFVQAQGASNAETPAADDISLLSTALDGGDDVAVTVTDLGPALPFDLDDYANARFDSADTLDGYWSVL